MANDISEYEGGGGIQRRPDSQANNLLATIATAAADPNVDAGKMQALADLAIRLQTHEQQQQFNRDRNAAILEMPVISKDGRIVIPGKNGEPDRVQGRFAKLEDIDRVIKPIAARHNIAYFWDVGEDAGVPKVFIELSHANGHVWRSSGMKLPLDTSGAKNNVQGAGSSVTYGKRYTLCAAFNIQTEGIDDDGNGGLAQVQMPHERGDLVMREAEAAAEAGRYSEWFSQQSPKDRGWLVTSGHHARLGGQPVIAPPSAPTHVASTARDAAPAAPETEKRMSIVDRVAAYEADVAQCATLEDLRDLQMKRADWLAQLRQKRPDLADRIAEAGNRRYAQLSDGNQVDSTAGNQGDSGGSDLFGGDVPGGAD